MSRRIYKWDNMKAIMMLCVVMGHSIYRFLDVSTAKGVYTFIYTFHIPVFIFISGMFAKKAVMLKRYEKAFDFVCIYFVMKMLDAVSKALVTKKLSLHFFWEDGIGWYAFAIAVFLLVTIWTQNFDRRKVFLLALLIGLMAGMDDHLGNHFVSMRICVFYPVYLAGFYLQPGRIQEWIKANVGRRIALTVLGVMALLAMLLICLTHPDQVYQLINTLKGKQPYHRNIELVYRLIWYLAEILIIGIFILIVPDVKCYLTEIGQRTMSIFIYHGCIFNIIYEKLGLRRYVISLYPGHPVFAAICIGLVIALLSSMIPSQIFKKVKSQD